MTQPKYTNADCPLYGSEYCAALNMESCEKCTVDCTDEEKTARVKQDLADMAALLPEDGADDRAICSAVYGSLLLSPDRAKEHLPELIAALEPLARDPVDATARLHLYDLRSLLENPG